MNLIFSNSKSMRRTLFLSCCLALFISQLSCERQDNNTEPPLNDKAILELLAETKWEGVIVYENGKEKNISFSFVDDKQGNYHTPGLKRTIFTYKVNSKNITFAPHKSSVVHIINGVWWFYKSIKSISPLPDFNIL